MSRSGHRAGLAAASGEIPMCDLNAQHTALESELREAMQSVVASSRFILGSEVSDFEAALAAECGVRFGIGCNSGTDALWLALRALGIGPGDAVLCPAFSFFATAATIVRLGARPIFVDVDPTSLNLDIEDALRRSEGTANLRAVLTADLFGRRCELGALAEFADERGIPIIEDAAQSIASRDESGETPGMGVRVACFSFYPTKNLGAMGDGGGLVSDDEALATHVQQLRMHGEITPGRFNEVGINSRLDALQAAVLNVKLRHLDAWGQTRRKRALHYDALFAERGACPSSQSLSDSALGLLTPEPAREPARHVYHRYVVRVAAERRSELRARLAEEGIASEIYYPTGLHEQPALEAYAPGPSEAALSATERVSREVLALPLYPELSLDALERVVACVTQVLRD